MGIGGAIAILFGFLFLVGLILWWLAYRAPVGFEGDDGFEYGEPAGDDGHPDLKKVGGR